MNPYIGRSQEWLEEKLQARQDDLAESSLLVAAGAGDVNSQRQVLGNIKETIEQLYAALRKLDPTTYPAADTVRNERTGVAFS